MGRLDRSLNQRALQLVEGMGPVAVRGASSAPSPRRAPSAAERTTRCRSPEKRSRSRACRGRSRCGSRGAEQPLHRARPERRRRGCDRGGARGRRARTRIGSSDLPRVLEPGRDGGDARSARGRRASLSRRSGARASPRQPYQAQPWPGAALAMSAFEQGSWDEAVHGARAREASGDVHYLDAALSLVEAEIVLAREGRLLAGSVSDALDAARGDRVVQLLVPVLARGSIPPLGGRRGCPGRAVARRVRRCVDRRRVLPAGPVVCRPRPGVARRGRRRRAGGLPARA